MPQAKELDVKTWQHTCPQCGYENGFHISFRRVTADEEGNDMAVWLICPSCSELFDIGLRIRLDHVPVA